MAVRKFAGEHELGPFREWVSLNLKAAARQVRWG